MTTHPDDRLLAAYRDLTVGAAAAASVETHLTACQRCRSAFAGLAGSGESAEHRDEAERIWAKVVDVVDQPRLSGLERGLRRLGVSDTTARVIGATPALRLAWLVAVAVLVAFAIGAARAAGDPFVLLALAPLVPVAGVATAFGPWLDPTYELGVAAPLSGFRLVLLRTSSVLATGSPLLLAASALVPGGGWEALAWVLPALALTTVSLAASTWVRPERAGGAVGLAWLVAVTVLFRPDGTGGLAERTLAFRPPGQLLAVAVAAAAAIVFVQRRRRLDAVAYA